MARAEAEAAGGDGRPKARKRAAVVVLGDVGRSPRMQYHAMSLADQAGMEVDVVGYGGSVPHIALVDNPHIHLHYLGAPFTSGLPRVLYLLLLPLKLLVQVLALLRMLCFSIPPSTLILLQNPPTIPVLGVVQLACWLRGAKLIVDWHNFGYTLLGLRLGPRHPLVRVHRWYERRYGRHADAHLCVTRAMQQELRNNWGIRATVLYDRPPTFFRKATEEERRELFHRLADELNCPMLIEAAGHSSRSQPGTTGDAAATRPSSPFHRPAVIVSSTSWSADEDFGVLLEAALMYDRQVSAMLGEKDEAEDVGSGGGTVGEEEDGCGLDEGGVVKTQSREGVSTGAVKSELQEGVQGESERAAEAAASPYPKLLFLITGRGPLREQWEEKMRKLRERLRRVEFTTAWVSAEDYPRVLGSADLGVSLHTSSSGLDLPMKVVDMFGCGLPVCAIAYSCIEELVHDGDNGLLFSTSAELTAHLLHLFREFAHEGARGAQTTLPAARVGQDALGEHKVLLEKLQHGAASSGSATRWTEEWGRSVLPIVKQLCDSTTA